MAYGRAQIPNTLSISRVPAAIAFLLFYSNEDPLGYIAAVTIAAIAVVTDFLDGYLARRWDVTSDIGYFLDGLGDKAFYFAVLIVMIREHASNGVLVWILIAREIFLYALRSIDKQRADNLKRLRALSLYYALFIRLYFLCFFSNDAYRVSGRIPPNVLQYGDLFGYAAAIFGFVTITALMRNIARSA